MSSIKNDHISTTKNEYVMKFSQVDSEEVLSDYSTARQAYYRNMYIKIYINLLSIRLGSLMKI